MKARISLIIEEGDDVNAAMLAVMFTKGQHRVATRLDANSGTVDVPVTLGAMVECSEPTWETMPVPTATPEPTSAPAATGNPDDTMPPVPTSAPLYPPM